MKRVLFLFLLLPTTAFGHEGHVHGPLVPASPATPRLVPAAAGAATQGATTGSGRFTFRHLPLELPAAVGEHLVHAHGGFARDHVAAGGDGSTYFSLKGVGLLRLSPDLGELHVVGGAAPLHDANLHNTCLFRREGRAYLALPSDEAQRAYVTTLEGELLHTLGNPYGESGEAFRVCDMEYVGGRLFAANGYADNVVFTVDPFAAVAGEAPAWSDFRFGGSGSEHGRFGTAHGITRIPHTETFTISDRANARLESFTEQGRYIGGIALPPGAMPCDVDYHEDLALVGCLKGPDGSTPAPIYLFENGNLVAELNPGRDLGLEGFTHIHNAAFHVRRTGERERLYVLVYAWNPGNFAILEQVWEPSDGDR